MAARSPARTALDASNLSFRRLYPRKHSLGNEEYGPLERSGHTLVISPDGVLYLFGGFNDGIDKNETTGNQSSLPMFDELWKYDTRLGLGWEFVLDPDGYFGCTCAYLNDHLVIFGGENVHLSLGATRNAQSFNIHNGDWEIHSNVWKVTGHAMVNIGKDFYIFGGEDYGKVNNIMLKIDVGNRSWTLMSNNLFGPPGRSFHGMATNGEEIFIFGGKSATGTENLVVIWGFHIKSRRWAVHISQADPIHGYPLSRRMHTVGTYDGKAFIVGGIGIDDQMFNDIWMMNMEGKLWTLLNVRLKRPVYQHASCISQDGLLYVFGGVIGRGSPSIRSKTLYKLDLKPFIAMGPTEVRQAIKIQPVKGNTWVSLHRSRSSNFAGSNQRQRG